MGEIILNHLLCTMTVKRERGGGGGGIVVDSLFIEKKFRIKKKEFYSRNTNLYI